MTPLQPPFHWRSQPLKELATEFISGGTPSTGSADFWDGEVPWTTSAPIGDEAVVLTHAQRFITDAGLQGSAANLVPRRSLLVGTRVGVGKAVVNELDIAISQDLTGVVIDSELAEMEFLAYQFKVERVREFFDARSRGTTIKGVSRFDLEHLDLWLPPLPEQRAIVRVLRAVQEAKEARQRELALERERKVALMEFLFTHSTGSELSKQTEIGKIPSSWEIVTLGAMFETQLGKMLSQKAKTGKNWKLYLRNANVQWGRVDLKDVYEMDFTEREERKFRLRGDDLLVCEGGEIGRTAIWRDELEECYFQKAIHRLRPRSTDMRPMFLLFWMEWAFRLDNIYGVAGTKTTIAHLPQDKLEQMRIPKPPLGVQEEIVSVLSRCESKVAALEAETGVLSELFRAMLEELMTGGLSAVPLISEESVS